MRERGLVYQRDRRARQKADRERDRELVNLPPVDPEDMGAVVASWSESELVVPPGHPKAGEPFRLPEYGVRFLSEALVSREALLCVGRKNAKSAIIAVLLLAYLAGPLRSMGWRAGVCSVTKDKAGELRKQAKGIAEAVRPGSCQIPPDACPGSYR